MKNDKYKIDDNIVEEDNFIFINFDIGKTKYLFTAHFEGLRDETIKKYQISFDSYENIKRQQAYEPMKANNAAHFFVRIFECLLLKISDKLGPCCFVALPASEKLFSFYKKLAQKYNNNNNSIFTVVLMKDTFKGSNVEYEYYSIKRK